MRKLIARLNSQDVNFAAQFQQLLRPESAEQVQIDVTVKKIIAEVRQRGDTAVLEYTEKFDHWSPASGQALKITNEYGERTLSLLEKDEQPTLQALRTAAENIRDYHQRQVQASWSYRTEAGTLLGQKITPVERVGIYVPGGSASYPSSVLMNAIPAKIAGVQKIIMMVPTPKENINPWVIAAAEIAGVDEIFRVGGAQAIAALAYGTQTIPRVDKIVGPGNAYVAEAKRQVFGQVGIDMIAGPSEILVVCDGKTDPRWVVLDLFSQAEHDPMAQAILICPDEDYLNQIEKTIEALLPQQSRADIIQISLRDRGALIQVKDLEEAVELVNDIAPEHLALSVDQPELWANKIRHAGAIFMGPHTAEVFGDYCAGPNHVLPTSGSARFFSPLGVYDFQKRTSLIQCTPSSATELAKTASLLAYREGLTAHAQAAECRSKAD